MEIFDAKNVSFKAFLAFQDFTDFMFTPVDEILSLCQKLTKSFVEDMVTSLSDKADILKIENKNDSLPFILNGSDAISKFSLGDDSDEFEEKTKYDAKIRSLEIELDEKEKELTATKSELELWKEKYEKLKSETLGKMEGKNISKGGKEVEKKEMEKEKEKEKKEEKKEKEKEKEKEDKEKKNKEEEEKEKEKDKEMEEDFRRNDKKTKKIGWEKMPNETKEKVKDTEKDKKRPEVSSETGLNEVEKLFMSWFRL